MVSNCHQSPKVLVTRPGASGQALVKLLAEHNISASHQSLFDYQSHQNKSQLSALLKQQTDSVIFVSPAAVEFAQALLPISDWPVDQVFAVGASTQALLAELGVDAICPERFDSEGLLALPELNQIAGQRVVIVRGDGGRELLAEKLTERGALVQYFESYRRVWRKLPKTCSEQWKAQQINCMVVTSVAILVKLTDLIEINAPYWQQDCHWLVASERIARQAKSLGMANVIVAAGANNQMLVDAIQQLT